MSSEAPTRPARSAGPRTVSAAAWATGASLWLATALFVLWQNSRLGVLWDLSYVLENAARISLGDLPYRNFPLPYAPLTFVTQASLMKLTGHVYFHHVIYCAVVGGAATVLTWRIVLNLLRGSVAAAPLVAGCLTVPVTVLGIYSIFPHPFYDPDCTFAILACVLLLQQAERKAYPPLRSLLTGAALVVPLFIKQNVGMAFLVSAAVALLVLTALALWRRQSSSGYLCTLAGAGVGLLAAAALIHSTVGLGNYLHWTIQFASERRLPMLAEMFAIYRSWVGWLWSAAFLAGAALSRPSGRSWRARGALLLMALPFAWVLLALLIAQDAADRAEWLLLVWPFVIVAGFVLAAAGARRTTGLRLVLPFILIGTMHGAFLSQQLWGSTYAIWPLLVILLAATFAALARRSPATPFRAVPLSVTIAACLLITGGYYAWSHERLDYADLSQGNIVHSTLPALHGLSVRGEWIPDFEELVAYSEHEIPHDDGLLMIPGEDLFYFATGRLPRFPVVMFDHTINPYSPEQILELVRARDIRWLVVKRELQLEADPVEHKQLLLELLRQEFEPQESLRNYDVYRRKQQ